MMLTSLKTLRPAVLRGLGIALTVLTLTACAVQVPVTVSPTFIDRPPPPMTPAAAALAPPPCGLNIVQVVDARRVPGTLGVVAGRSVKSPDDPVAWLTSILGGLNARGFTVTFDKTQTEPPATGGLVANVSLTSAWLTDSMTNKIANVVLHVSVRRAGFDTYERDYRGSLTRMNWASTESELKKLADDAFAVALDDMGRELRALCKV